MSLGASPIQCGKDTHHETNEGVAKRCVLEAGASSRAMKAQGCALERIIGGPLQFAPWPSANI